MDIRKLASAVTDNKAGYEDISSIIESFLSNLGLKFSLKPNKHPSFISGRCASVRVRGKETGIIGEIHPQVLNNWNIEKPVACFELDLSQLIKLV